MYPGIFGKQQNNFENLKFLVKFSKNLGYLGKIYMNFNFFSMICKKKNNGEEKFTWGRK